MRESKIYLNFFKRNKWLILTPAFLLSLTFFSYQTVQQPRVHQSLLLEMEYNQENIQQRTVLLDEAVTLIRSAHLQNLLGLSGGNELVIFKQGPLVVNIDVGGKNTELVKSDLDKVKSFAVKNYPFKQIGVVFKYSQKTSELLYGLTGFTAGLLGGIFLSLVKTYFKKY